jgi:hypothetical protein
VAQTFAASKPERQWHTSELLKGITPHLKAGERPDKYILEFALKTMSKLRDTGRMTWQVDTSSSESGPESLQTACHQLLGMAEGPLKSTELKRQLKETRGFSAHFQLHEREGLIRIDRGVWGLVERDSGLDASQRATVLAALLTGLGIHKDGLIEEELDAALKEIRAFASLETGFI